MVEKDVSMLSAIGSFIAPIFAPLGWGDWKATVAAVTGLVAKEEVVSTFGILYGFGEVSEAGEEIWANMRESFTPLSAMSFLIFNLICAPCFAAIGAIKREMETAKWTAIAVGFQTVLAYVLALIYYQLGMVFMGGSINIGTIFAIVFSVIILYLLFRPERKNRKVK